MPKPTPRPLVPCLLALTLFVLVLSPAPAAAAPWEEGGPAAGFFGRFWGVLSAIWSEAGCIIVSNGGCRDRQTLGLGPGPTSVSANSGCILDPYGRCRDGAAVTPNIGCILDPNGSRRK